MDRLLRRLLGETRAASEGHAVSNEFVSGSPESTAAGRPRLVSRVVDCDWELVAAYAEGRLGLGEREKLEGHLAQCLACRRMATAMLEERPEAVALVRERKADRPWWQQWNWNWAAPALATALIVGSVIFYQWEQILRHGGRDRGAAQLSAERQIFERQAAGPQAAARGNVERPRAEALGAVQNPLGVVQNPTLRNTPLATPVPTRRAGAEPADKTMEVRAFDNLVGPARALQQAAEAPPPPPPLSRPVPSAAPGAAPGIDATARRDTAAETALAQPELANAVGQSENRAATERAVKALPQPALAAGATEAVDLANKKVEAEQLGRSAAAAPKVAASPAPARPRSEASGLGGNPEAARKVAPQSVTAPPAAGVAGGVVGGIVGGQPQGLSPLPDGVPIRSWIQHDGRLWAVSDGGRIFRSEDAGRTWRPIPSPTTEDLVSVKWDAATSSLLLEDKQGRQYRAEP